LDRNEDGKMEERLNIKVEENEVNGGKLKNSGEIIGENDDGRKEKNNNGRNV
jgi:hypothetical protein